MSNSISDPVCGNCGEPRSHHYFERKETFCYPDTTGDTYTDEPPEQWVMEELAVRHPHLYDEIRMEWKKENGHAATIVCPECETAQFSTTPFVHECTSCGYWITESEWNHKTKTCRND